MDVEHLNVVLGAKLGGLRSGLSDADRLVEKTKRSLQGMERASSKATGGTATGAHKAAGALKTMEGAARGVNRQLQHVERTAGRVGSGLATVAKRAAQVATVVGTGLATAVVTAGFRFNALKERSMIALTTMLGSGRKAQQLFASLAAFARRTPFELPQLIETSQKLIAFGLDAKRLFPVLNALGNAVAAVGGDPEKLDRTAIAIGQVQAKGRVMAEEMLQLTEAGTFSWKALADAIGVSVPQAMKLVEKGAVSSDAFLAAFVQNSETRFKGLMAKQAGTFTGLISNLRDTWAQVSGQLTKPLFDVAVREMAKLVAITQTPAFTAGVERFATWLGVKIPAGIAAVVGFFRTHWGTIQAGFAGAAKAAADMARFTLELTRRADAVAQALGGWKSTLLTLGTAWVALKAAALATMLAIRVAAVATARTIRVAMISTGIGAVVVALGIAAEQMILHWDAVKRGVSRAATAVRDIWNSVFEWLKRTTIQVALAVIEPFSHLPGGMGRWAREMKKELKVELGAMESAAATAGFRTGAGWGGSFRKSSSTHLTRFAKEVTIATTPIEDLRSTGKLSGDTWGNAFYNASLEWLTRFSAKVTTATASIEQIRSGRITKGGAIVPGGEGLTGIYPAGTKTRLGGGPGQGTHAQPDWQSGNAYDIHAQPGTPVLSPVDGKVVRVSGRDPSQGTVSSGGKNLYGYGVTISGGSNATTYYLAHLDNVTVRPGQTVRRGQVIGYVAAWKGGSAHVHVAQPWGIRPTVPEDTGTGGGGATGDVGLDGALPPAPNLSGIATGKKSALAGQVQTQRSRLQTEVERIDDLVRNKLLAKDVIAALKARAAQVGEALDKARGKPALAKAQEKLKGLHTAIGDAGKLQDVIRDINDAVSNKLLSPEVASRLMENARGVELVLKRGGKGAKVAAEALARDLAGALKADVIRRKAGADMAEARAEFGRQLEERFVTPIKAGSFAAIKAAERAIRALQAKLKTTKGQRMRLVIETQIEARQRVIEQNFAGILNTVDKQRGRFERAYAKVARRAMQAFDLETRRGLKAIEARFAGPTPAEAALAGLEGAHDAEQRAQAMAEALEDLRKAEQEGDAEGVRRAQQRIRDLQYEDQRAALQKQAEAERRARDEQREAEIEAYQQRRDEERTALEEWLEELHAKLLEGNASALEDLKKLGGLAGEVGASLGYELAEAFGAELDAIKKEWLMWMDLINEAAVDQGREPPFHIPDELRGPRKRKPPPEQFFGAQHGADFIARRPTPLLVGEGWQAEHVKVTPLGAGARGQGSGGGDVHVHVHIDKLLGTDRTAARQLARLIGPELKNVIQIGGSV